MKIRKPSLFTVLFLFFPASVIFYLVGAWYLLSGTFALLLITSYLLDKTALEEEHTLIMFALFGLILLVFVLLPVAELLYDSYPALSDAVRDKGALGAIFISMSAAAVATLLGLVFGTPLAYVLARKNFMGKNAVEAAVDLPMVIPHTVAGIALLVVFGRHGSLGKPMGLLGMNFVDAFPGIVIAMLFVSVPFIINQVREGFEDIDPRMEKVAMSLGADRRTVFTTVSLPLIKRNIFSGAVMAWARAISEFGAVVILAYFPLSAPVYIYETFTSRGLTEARPIAALLLIVTLFIFIVLRTLTRRFTIYAKD